MPRIRTIKPEFYRHHDLFLAEKTSKLPIRVAFSGLWLCADKEGRFKWKPTELKLDILPYDELDFNEVLECLIKNKFIIKYTVDNKDYGFIPTFKDHQRITGTEKNYDSKIPEYTGNTMESQSVSIETVKKYIKPQNVDNQMAFQSVSTETSRMTGMEIEIEKERSIGTVIPENFWLLNIYNKKFIEVQRCFPDLSEKGFCKWKHFIDFIYQKSFHEIFRFKCINPVDFEKLDFPENEWEETIRMLLSTGIEEKHNLFFRIPQFQKYAKKGYKKTEPLSNYESEIQAQREKYKGKK